MWFRIIFVIFIVPREICNINMQYVIWRFFYMCVLFFKFPMNDPISEFNKNVSSIYNRILILKNSSLSLICEFFWSHTYIKCHNLYMNNFIYISIYLQTFIFYSVTNIEILMISIDLRLNHLRPGQYTGHPQTWQHFARCSFNLSIILL